jgi:hypothetical protein
LSEIPHRSLKILQKLFSRGLAIGGPGAKIYAVPESTDLEQLALTHKARKLEDKGVLVARGPAIFYNREA